MAAIVPQTVLDGLVLCGVPVNIIWNGANHTQRIAMEVFNNNFNSCLDKTFAQLDEDWKSYSAFTVANGQIRLSPMVKNRIRVSVQWVRDEIRMGRNPTDSIFPVADAGNLICRYTMHKQWLDRASDKASTAKPKVFTESMKWLDWKVLFNNFLHTQPGHNGVPLSSYVTRENDLPIVHANVRFLDDYVDQAPLQGPAFASDNEEVHTYLTSLISGNDVAEAKLQPIMAQKDGRANFKALCEHYEGVGVNASAIIKAEEDIANLFYIGEKKPHMWWQEFETRLTNAFAVIDKENGRAVYSNSAKLRLLNKKIKADFLEQSKTVIELELSRTQMTMTYNLALTTFRNAVNRKFPLEQSTKHTRRVQETSTEQNGGKRNRNNNYGGRGRGRGRARGRGRGGRGGHHGNNRSCSCMDACFIQCTNGSRLEVHPTYRFSREDWQKIPSHVRDDLIARRRAAQQQRNMSQTSSVGSSVESGGRSAIR